MIILELNANEAYGPPPPFEEINAPPGPVENRVDALGRQEIINIQNCLNCLYNRTPACALMPGVAMLVGSSIGVASQAFCGAGSCIGMSPSFFGLIIGLTTSIPAYVLPLAYLRIYGDNPL